MFHFLDAELADDNASLFGGLAAFFLFLGVILIVVGRQGLKRATASQPQAARGRVVRHESRTDNEDNTYHYVVLSLMEGPFAQLGPLEAYESVPGARLEHYAIGTEHPVTVVAAPGKTTVYLNYQNTEKRLQRSVLLGWVCLGLSVLLALLAFV